MIRNQTSKIIIKKINLIKLSNPCFYFQEVLDSQYPNIPENEDQLLTPYSTPRRHNHTDASFLHIPPPLSPLRDLDDILLSPPNSLETQDRHTDRFHSSRNLSILFNEMPRDM